MKPSLISKKGSRETGAAAEPFFGVRQRNPSVHLFCQKPCHQGDQVGLIFAYLELVFFGQFFLNYRNGTIL
jgi:hypothetical protein